jgi:hypothetical protein
MTKLTTQDMRGAFELCYAAARIGFVDASVVATAERLGISRILTTGRGDFAMIGPRHCKTFELLP